MGPLRNDVIHAWRSLRRRRAYFFTCAATLALVLGANAAIFAAVSATLLRPLPFDDDARVVQLFMLPPGMSAVSQRNPPQQMDVVRFRERARTMTRLEGFLRSDRVIAHAGEPVVVPSAAVTAGLLEMMGIRLQTGRGFLADDVRARADVSIVTDRYWQRAMAAGTGVNSALVIDGRPHTVVGILAPGDLPAFLRADVLTLLAPDATPTNRNPARSVVTVAELAEGASIAAADAEVRELTRQLGNEFPRTHGGWTAGAQAVREWQYGAVRTPLLVLFAATASVLLIACANLANLTSAQAAARSADLSLRVALGATRLDVLRLQVVELLIVTTAGLVPGLVLASLALPALLALNPVAAQTLGPVAVDWRVQGFTALAALFTAFAAAILPTVQLVRRQAVSLTEVGRRATGSRETRRFRRTLVGIEVALCVALLMAGAVLLRGLQALTRLDPGFDARGVLTAQIRLPEATYSTPESRTVFVTRLLDNVRAVPGVASASTTMNQFVPGFTYQTMFHVEHRPTPDGQPHTTQFRRISPDYFRTMGIAELRGRTFTASDTADAPAVAVVSRQLAEQLFPGEEAVGRVIRRTAADAPAVTIVGVVGDVHDVSLTQSPEPTLYLPWAQNSNFTVPVSLVVRTAMDPVALVPSMRAALTAVDPGLPLRDAQPLVTFLADSLAPERFRTAVLGMISVLGLTLALLGIYGVTYRGVVDRTHEFAVRLALGAGRGGVVRLILAESLRDVAAGAGAGVLVGFVLCGVIRRLVANAGDGTTGTAAAAVTILAVAAMAAALVPALTVLRVQPADALAER